MRVILPFLLLLSSGLFAQGLQPTLLADLPSVLQESSGLLIVEGQVWTIGDSGNPNKLYRLDPSTGAILREVGLLNASNVDWEEVTSDESWVYVGDIGNNYGNRTDLRVYRFPLEQLLDPAITSVLVDTIGFAFADQTDFTPIPLGTNWDCEAFIAHGDSLYLFTKNWADLRSYVYALPAEPGMHMAQRRDTLESMGLITGAALDRDRDVLVLLGYDLLMHPFVWRFSDYSGTDFFSGLAHRHSIALTAAQTEGIAWAAPDTVFFTNEEETSGSARLWRLALGVDASVQDASVHLQLVLLPNPTSRSFRLEGKYSRAHVALRDEYGAEVLEKYVGPQDTVDVSHLATGLYLVEVGVDGTLRNLRLSVVH